MNTPAISPLGMVAGCWRNRALIGLLTAREIVGRYRGSALGLVWSLVTPLLMLVVYTFVFSVVFQARWGTPAGSRTEFALVLFAGLMVYALFAEVLNRAPTLVLSNVNYVKKVVFPLDTLVWVAMGSALFHLFVSFIVWLAAYAWLIGMPPATAVLFPVVLAPLLLGTAGLSWILASLGVYVRDIAQLVAALTATLLFLTPIFYPLDILPPEFRDWIALNPLTPIIGWARDVLIFGKAPDWQAFSLLTLSAAVLAWLGFAWFQKTRKGFADVL